MGRVLRTTAAGATVQLAASDVEVPGLCAEVTPRVG